MSIKFENILNFRDVGKTVNDYLGKRLVREGVLYRSARPDDATLGDRSRLIDELGIKTVLDLRTKTEHLKQAQKRKADLKVPALLQSNAALAEPIKISGLEYREIRVTGSRFERAMLKQLSWWNLIKLICLFMIGRRISAIRIMSREVMVPLGLVGLSLVTLDESGPEIAEALRTLLPSPSSTPNTPSPTPVLVHCTQGKDRTGIIIALLLLALSVPSTAITYDYLLSQSGLKPERESRLAEIEEIGLTAEWGDCPEELIPRLCSHIDVRYGGIDGYLDAIGFGGEERIRLLDILGA
ncbi:protein-tyrosine phosphatase-like protein [Xylariaceae sp. FL1272]|nr:protein-tyrosine phosphatase-like protein [Xylariaceae sp. FL1272]